MIPRHPKLGPDGSRMRSHQRQQRMSGGGGDNLKLTLFLPGSERRHEVPSMTLIKASQILKSLVIKTRERRQGRFPPGAMDFPPAQLHQPIQMPGITGLQQGIE